MREYRHGAVQVTDKVTYICSVPQDISFVTLHNDGPDRVYVGNESVAPSGPTMGLPLEPGEKHDLPTYDSDSIDVYAVAQPDSVVTVVFLVSS